MVPGSWLAMAEAPEEADKPLAEGPCAAEAVICAGDLFRFLSPQLL